ncbi:MAG: coenzyme F420-0:L-glutamate ligase [Negativicutes bacterium]|nr:coenzyme F420-0:L-glutamate ligase [Negativicutes bacterium]
MNQIKDGIEIVPVKTRIVTPDDDIVEIVAEYTDGLVGPDDVVAVAESVVAISQGRVIRPEEIKVGMIARLLCRLVPQKGSMSSVYGFQTVMNCEGTLRVVAAMLVGMVTKLFGVSGVFYRLAGEQSRLIDDITGTMPPFDKHIVLGPDRPDDVAAAIRQRMSCFGAAVTDVNDLKKSLIVGSSGDFDREKLRRLFIDNPFGNDSQKTPVCIVKNCAQYLGARGKMN